MMGDCGTTTTTTAGGGASSPLKACLIAPPFSPPRKENVVSYRGPFAKSSVATTSTTASAPPTHVHPFGTAPAASAAPNAVSSGDDPGGKNNVSSCSSSSVAFDIARKAYRKVRRERDVKRREMVREVLRESRDGAIFRDTSSSGSDAIEYRNGYIRGKRKAEVTPPSRRNKEGRNNNNLKPMDHDAVESEGNDFVEMTCPDDDGNGEGESSDDEQNGRSTSPPLRQTLVFPRLPSNDCPSYQVFTPPLCSPTSDEGSNSDAESGAKLAIGAVPPNLSKSSGDERTLTIKSRHRGHNNQTTTTSTTTTTAAATATTNTTTTTIRRAPLLLEGAHAPRPKSSSLIFLKTALVCDDEPSLSHVPYFEDGDDEDIYSDLFDTSERERLYEFGPKYREEETLATVDEALRTLGKSEERKGGRGRGGAGTMFRDRATFARATKQEMAEGTDGGDDGVQVRGGGLGAGASRAKELETIHSALAELANVDVERVHESHLRCFFVDETPEPTATEEDNAGSPSSSGAPRKNSDAVTRVPYADIMDSYRDLFCRRCFTYDCNLHGNLPKAGLDLLGELAVRKEAEGHWKELDEGIVTDGISNHEKLDNSVSGELTPAQQSICKRAHLIFQGDIERIARAIGAAPASVDAFVKSERMALGPSKCIPARPPIKQKGNRAYCSMKNYNPKWLRHIQSKVIHPAYLPCDHDGPCSDDNCSCVANGFFCTKACGWGAASPNFFRGCECRAGQCRTNTCPCYAANRECDPDLCRTCGACCDEPGRPAKEGGQRCRNDFISMRRHCHLLIGESRIKEAGWGLFTKNALRKGDFIHEYVGEIISQEEAERRGVIYDKMNMSYLFNLSSDLVVDATRKGNKARYANHSSTPNIEPKMVHVNGDMRIGFYAKHDIDAQSELFFNYRYDDKIDNELIFKPDHSVNFEWMNKKNRGHKKKNA